MRQEVGGCKTDSEQEWEAEAVEEDSELGAQKAEKMGSPVLPCVAEVEEHEKTHVPYRSWRRHCVKGKGTQDAHWRLQREEIGPELHTENAFMRDENTEELLTILVAKERTTRMPMSTVHQAVDGICCQEKVCFSSKIGCEHISMTVKTDDEPAMSALVTQISKVRAASGGQRFSAETSPAHSSASNRVDERGVQAVQGQVRVLRSAVEEKWGAKLQQLAVVGGVRVFLDQQV